jgi:hypothetical protein
MVILFPVPPGTGTGKCSVADPDPGSGAFLIPGSELIFFQISDPGSKTHISESLVKNFGLRILNYFSVGSNFSKVK